MTDRDENERELSREVRRALGLVGDAAMPPRTFDELAVPAVDAPHSGGSPPGDHKPLRVRWSAGGFAVAAAIFLAVLVIGSGDQDQTSTADTATATARGETWERLSPSGLAARSEPSVLWADTKVLVVGGDGPQCPTEATCEETSTRAMRDGAAYDIATDTWRRIADAPVAPAGARSATLGEGAYFLGRDQEADELTLLRYALLDDEWEAFEFPSDASLDWGLVATDEAIIAYAVSDTGGATADLVFDERGDWSELPLTGLGPAVDRHMIWAGDSLFLFDQALSPASDSRSPTFTRVTRFDPATNRWVRLPDSQVLTTSPWLLQGSRLINPRLGCDDGSGDNWDRCYPFGGVFDMDLNVWAELPALPAELGDTDSSAGAIGTTRSTIYDSGLPLFDATTAEWIDMPAIDNDAQTPPVVISIGADAFAYGGVRVDNDQLLDGAWIWRSGRAEGPVVAAPFVQVRDPDDGAVYELFGNEDDAPDPRRVRVPECESGVAIQAGPGMIDSDTVTAQSEWEAVVLGLGPAGKDASRERSSSVERTVVTGSEGNLWTVISSQGAVLGLVQTFKSTSNAGWASVRPAACLGAN